MDATTNRMINGLLKGFGGELSPETLEALLSRDVEIVAPAYRATREDLWPAIWALAAVLERQFFGRVFIRCGLTSCLPAPVPLGPRCEFTNHAQPVILSIGIGLASASNGIPTLIGDARQGAVAVGELLIGLMENPSPIECFLLAGYLGFAALAAMVGIPEYRVELAHRQLTVGYDVALLKQRIADIPGYTCVGLGQLGQAYLALLYFLREGKMTGLRLALIDRQAFEDDNGRTQILLVEDASWRNRDKHQYIAEVSDGWGANVAPRKHEIQWGWKKSVDDPGFALVGLDDLEVRRMVMAAGFDRLLEAGVGTDLLRPRVSWHAVPGNPTLGRRLFPDANPKKDIVVNGDWVGALKQTPGECGWVRFRDISATAPCMGVAAAAFAMSELGCDTTGSMATTGCAMLWSPCLPILREFVQ